MKTSIVILTHNQLSYTVNCIDSIRKHTGKGDYEIIAVDNNSTDGTADWLKQQKDIKTIFNDKNYGYPSGCNQGIKASSYDNILFLNNDTIVTQNWLNNLLKCLYSDKKVAAVGPVTNASSYYQSIDTNFKDIDELDEFAENYNKSNPDLWETRIKLIGFCFLVKRKVIDQIGMLDESFDPGNFEDDDLSLRIRRAGYSLVLCKDTFIYHYGSISFNQNREEYAKLLEINKKKFIKKWGFDPGYSTFIRNEIVDLIDCPKDKHIKVLDVGCACGTTLLKIKNNYKNSDLYGIELNKNSAADAKLYADVTVGNIENKRLKYDKNSFDYIIAADIFEHLIDPWKVLRKLKGYLKEDGYILSSIPNVMNHGVIKNLLCGLWEYQDAGILDKTHLRFFTLYEIDKMFKQCGFNNIEYGYSQQMISADDSEFIDQLTKITSEDARELFSTYQFIVKASCRNGKGKTAFENDKGKDQLKNEQSENKGYYIDPSCDIRCADRVKLGKNVILQKDCWINAENQNIQNGLRIEIGDGTNVGRRSTISSSNKIIIGQNVLIAPNVLITDHNHKYTDTGIPISMQGIDSSDNTVMIRDNAWIGTNSVVQGNVKIGRGSVIGANSVVLDDIPDYCVAVGSPAKVIKIFDITSGKWISVKSKADIDGILASRKNLTDYIVPFRCMDSLQVEVSSKCCMNCEHCFNKVKGHKSQFLDKKLWDQKIKPYLGQFKNIYLVGIGEPLLSPDFFSFVEDSVKKGLTVHTTSNLQTVDRITAERIVSSGINFLSISCDGCSKEVFEKVRKGGDYEKFINALGFINEYKKSNDTKTPVLILNYGMSADNINELPDIIEFCIINDIHEIVLYHYIIYKKELAEKSLYHYKDLSDKMLRKTLELAVKAGIHVTFPGFFDQKPKCKKDSPYCLYPFCHLFIYSDGRVGPCCMDFPNRYVLGYLKDSDMKEVWNNINTLKLRNELLNVPSDTCKYCAMLGKMDLNNPKYIFRFDGVDEYIKDLNE